MATVLSQYQEQQKKLLDKLPSGLTNPELLALQELNYRISVLQTMQVYCKTAPVSTDVNALGFHYQLVSASLRFLLSERRFGLKPDEKLARQRETAAASLEKIFSDQNRRFQSFKPTAPELYRKSLQEMVNTVLPAWIAYRTSYINTEEVFS